jgi:ribosomal protein S18 acetylase RimI-like enzyme
VRAAVEDNLFAFLRAIAELPGGELEEDERMLRIATGLPSPMHNSIGRANLAAEDVEAAVQEVADWYRERNTRFFWWTGPQSTPSDLEDRLLAAGLQEFERDMPGMAMPLADMDESGAYPPGVTVEEVRGEDGLRDWARLFCNAHGAPPLAAESWVEAARRVDFAELPWKYWVAWLDGEHAGLGLSYVGGGAVGLFAIGTLPGARRRGVGSALTLVPMLEAREQGVEAAILQATPDGEQLYLRLGFQEYGRLGRFLGGA